ncbi:MAG: N-acetyltransferase family protein [Steroidobacteraceae bacterium]|jgi:phosphinothricin acetyltransferase
MILRPAAHADLAGITAIYNEVIASSTAIYSYVPVTLEDRTQWLSAREQQGYPVLVAADGSEILGFSTFGDWRSWPGYRFTVEHSVHIQAAHRGQGIGKALVQALFPLALALDKHVMIGGIDAANQASIRFHERLGFVPTGEIREVGHKFGRWLDLVFMQRLLDAPGTPRS